MELTDKLKNENINPEKLEKGLKSIGLNLSRFNNIREEQFPALIELFNVALDITPSISKYTKIEIRSKLDKILKGQQIVKEDIHVLTNKLAVKKTETISDITELKNKIAEQEHATTTEKKDEEPKIIVQKTINTQQKRMNKDSLIDFSKQLKLGKVKFFDSIKGFGFIDDLFKNKSYFVHISKLQSSEIEEDDIVIFETVASRKKPGDFDAVHVCKDIPVFIFNRPDTLNYFAYPLLNDYSNKEIILKTNTKIKTEFAFINAKFCLSQTWKCFHSGTEGVPKEIEISFGKTLLSRFISREIDNIETIEWLTTVLLKELQVSELIPTYIEIIEKLDQKKIPELEKEIINFRDISFFKLFRSDKINYSKKISFVLWHIGDIDTLPDMLSNEDDLFWCNDVLPQFNWKCSQEIILRLLSEKDKSELVKKTFEYLKVKGWEINNEDELHVVDSFLSTIMATFPSIVLEEANFKCITNRFYIELYQNGFLKELSEIRITQHIDDLNTADEKVAFIEKLPPDKISYYYSIFPSLSNYWEIYIAKQLESEFLNIDFLCFDLESDGDKISEFAWLNKFGVRSDADYSNREDGIAEIVTLINSGLLIIGQNIKEFDLQVLKKYGAETSSDYIWDTLEVEMLLNPERFSYGLKTQHGAKADTELTYKLFINQLSRIILCQSDLSVVTELLPQKAKDAISSIIRNSNWAALDFEYFATKSNDFFRPTPTNRNIAEQTFNQLSQKLNEDGEKVVIAPDFLWNTLSHQFNLGFYSDSLTLRTCLNKAKIEAVYESQKVLKTILLRFIISRKSKGIQPYFHHLPMAIRLLISREQSTLICDKIDLDFKNIANKPICIQPTNIDIFIKHINPVSDLKLIVVGHELYNLTSKIQLGQDLDFATIFDKLKNEPIWLQMSGGKSFIKLEKKHCIKLGIKEFPAFIQNLWLEKTGKGKFKVWCNINFETALKNIGISEHSINYIPWIDETLKKNNAFIVRPDARRLGFIAEQKRVNPESLNRKLFWVYQFKIFEGIANFWNPKVLIINDELEIEKISAYARQIGYFIPDNKATLARQIELLHTHQSTKKLIISTLQNLDKIISYNYLGPLDILWDSFLLQEKFQMLMDLTPHDVEMNDKLDEDDFIADVNSVQKDYDLFSLIKLHKPLIDYYYKMLYDNNPESELFLCDSRLTDYYGIEKSLNMNAKIVQMWYKESDYENDYEIAGRFFTSVHENAETDFNIEEAKEVLRQLFLPLDDSGKRLDWYSYQKPCLDDILPAEKDLLISLPTGAGKSLLFQGPALFRSAFSCRLTIVITPLRALMQDQVDALWKRGFLSNVEFLSADKSHVEIRDIYRRISGGEITLLYITPERFRSRAFENCLLTRLDADNGLEYIVFDEAHCISQWGQEFRPDYLNSARKVAGYSQSYQMRKLLFSATISDQVFEEICNILPGIVTVKGAEKNYNPVRDHIKMNFKHNVVEEDRLLEVSNYLKSGGFNPLLSRAIVFVKSRKKVEECALIMPDSLREVFGPDCSFAEKVGAFHAGMDVEDRKDNYEKFKEGDILILFATKAFGMGMDIPNIHFVTHYSPPGTFEDFLQEVGRAGRNEKQRQEAGFNNPDKPIRTLCLTSNNDFAKLKDQLYDSRISWPEVEDVKISLEKYISRFKPLTHDEEIPVAVPFNFYSNDKGFVDDDLDNKFRIALHWLERLERIKLGYFTITHLEFESSSLIQLSNLDMCPDKDCEKVCNAIIELLPTDFQANEVLQLSIASLRSISKLSLANLFTALLKCHSAGILRLLQVVLVEPTKTRLDETNYYKNNLGDNRRYPALRVIFLLAYKILESVPTNDSKLFSGDELDTFLKDLISETINFTTLPWTRKDKVEDKFKEYNNYINNIFKKRSNHAFTIIRLLGKTKHETKIEKVTDGNRKVNVIQSVFNGYHKQTEWIDKIKGLEKDCILLLDYVAKQYFDSNIKKFNWPDIIKELKLNENVQYLSDLFFILSVLGYVKTGGLLPIGIEVYLKSTDQIDVNNLENNDKNIFEEFKETQEIRELKLISLQVLSNLADDRKDAFIRGFFASKTKLELINHLQNLGDIDDEHPIFKAFRGEAIKYQEEHRLNEEQREIYFSEINQNINVVAGPGSGKTHTLTLRVARLIYYNYANPEEILVLAYNRAVVSELKERLGKLFKDLGFGNLAKRIKIFTFHGLAKKYCREQLEGLNFEQWEPRLLEVLNHTPGIIMNQLAPLKHVLVDEFQDIDDVRMDLLFRINELTNSHLFIIGDPNQSIYGYSRSVMDPYHYYNDFNNRFNSKEFKLLDNHRSYPDILSLASQILTLPKDRQYLIPRPTKIPEINFVNNYAQVINSIQQDINWWEQIPLLMQERVGELKYKQIAILFRTNNEVYRGFQKIKGLNLTNIRIRIQGSLPYEFTRIRECYAVILYLKSLAGQQIPIDFKIVVSKKINNLIDQNPNWNHFYLRVMHALVIEYLEEQDENQMIDNLIDFITELTFRDDGQLYKIYEKHLAAIGYANHEIEIVLTTMHKVKGLEFDCVVIPPSFSNLPLNNNDNLFEVELQEQINEEKRLAFVSYTRARYRLMIFKGLREYAIASNLRYTHTENENNHMGIPVQPELKKLNIGWAAKSYNFNNGVNGLIKKNIKSGDIVFVKRRYVNYNGNQFLVYELFKENTMTPIGEIARNANIIRNYANIKGFVVNEVVVWSYEDTRRFDLENNTNFAENWCQEARDQGYIYLVDFAGFGVPGDE
jgi:RecQ family ATP-dependent DNA helicase